MTKNTLLRHRRLIDESVRDIGRIHQTVLDLEGQVRWMREHRDHLMMLAKFNGARVHDIARECDISVQAVYDAIERTNARDDEG